MSAAAALRAAMLRSRHGVATCAIREARDAFEMSAAAEYIRMTRGYVIRDAHMMPLFDENMFMSPLVGHHST